MHNSETKFHNFNLTNEIKFSILNFTIKQTMNLYISLFTVRTNHD